MNLNKLIFTENACYKAGRRIKVKGIMVHSTGANNPYEVADEFEKLGYELLGEFGITGRRYIRKGGDSRTHNVHVFAETDIHNINRHLGFRDYLRQHPDTRKDYEALKRELALQFPHDIMAYNQGKEAFIRKIEAKAWDELAAKENISDNKPN